MSSISLPALHVNPPSDPTENLGRLVQLSQLLQNAPLQRQAMQQQVQSGQLDLQMKQAQIKSQQAVMRAFTDAQGDPAKAVNLASKYGALPQDVFGLRKSMLDQQKQTLDLVAQQGTLAKQQADLMQGAHDTVAAASPEERPAVYQQQLQGLQQAGIDVSKMPPQYPGDDAFKFIGAVVKSHSQQVEEALKTAQGNEAQQKANEAAANTNKINQEMAFGPTGPGAEAKYRFILGKVQSGQPVSDDELTYAKSFEASNAKTTTQSDSLGVTSSNTSKPAGLAVAQRGSGAKPAQGGAGSGTKESLVDMIGQYKLNPTMLQRMSVKHPDIIAAVGQKYPDWNQPNYNSINKIITGYTSGPQSREINAINTVAGHLDTLDQAADALKNGNVKLLNSIANKLGAQVGQTPQGTFQTIVHRVGPEITTAYTPGGGGEAERFANEKDFNVNLAPDQLKSNIGITVKLLRSKIGALESQYKQATGRDDFQTRFMTPAAQSSFNRLAGPEGSSSTGGSLQVGQTVKLRSGKTVKVTAVHSDGSFDAE